MASCSLLVKVQVCTRLVICASTGAEFSIKVLRGTEVERIHKELVEGGTIIHPTSGVFPEWVKASCQCTSRLDLGLGTDVSFLGRWRHVSNFCI